MALYVTDISLLYLWELLYWDLLTTCRRSVEEIPMAFYFTAISYSEFRLDVCCVVLWGTTVNRNGFTLLRFLYFPCVIHP